MQLPSLMNLRLEATYTITVNIDTSNGLTNGATGQLKKFIMGTMNDGSIVPLRIYLKFDSRDMRHLTREKNKHQTLKDDSNPDWVPIERRTTKMPE